MSQEDASHRNANSHYLRLLDKAAVESKTYFDFLLDGLKNADLRANGLYAVDPHCSDYTILTSECPATQIIYNDIADWPVGDHGSNATNDKGFFNYNLAQNNPITKTGDTWAQLEDKAYSGDSNTLTLLSVINGSTVNEKLVNLKSSMDNANASAMAVEFYSRAVRAWQENRRIDAFYNLGISFHLIQDMTVPTLIRIGENLGYTDFEYEQYVWNNYLSLGSLPDDLAGSYIQQDAKGWIDQNVEATFSFSANAHTFNDGAIFSVETGVSSPIGVIVSFFKDVNFIKPSMPWLSLLLDDDVKMLTSVVHTLPREYGKNLTVTIWLLSVKQQMMIRSHHRGA